MYALTINETGSQTSDVVYAKKKTNRCPGTSNRGKRLKDKTKMMKITIGYL